VSDNSVILTVQEVGQSKSGKPKVKAGGNWYFMGGSRDTGPINPPVVGQTIEARTGSFMIDGKGFLTIEAWRLPQANQAGQGPQRQAPPPPAGYIDEASLRFISNVVGSAIAAGTVKDPGQVNSWFQAAKNALEGKSAPIPFDDTVPGKEW
jgi:hypothetical protein